MSIKINKRVFSLLLFVGFGLLSPYSFGAEGDNAGVQDLTVSFYGPTYLRYGADDAFYVPDISPSAPDPSENYTVWSGPGFYSSSGTWLDDFFYLPVIGNNLYSINLYYTLYSNDGEQIDSCWEKISFVKVDLDVDVDCDGYITPFDEEDESFAGGIVPLGGFTEIKIADLGPEAKGTLTLQHLYPSENDKIRIWESKSKAAGTEVILPKTWDIGTDTIPTTLYVEGIEESLSNCDVRLTLDNDYDPYNCIYDFIYLTVLGGVDLDVDVNSDGYILSYDDDMEELQGGYVSLNDTIEIKIAPLNVPTYRTGSLTLSAVTGGDKIKIWTDPSKTEELHLADASWDVTDTIPTALYVEGITASSYSRDIELRLRNDDDLFDLDDTICLTVIPSRYDNIPLVGVIKEYSQDWFHIGQSCKLSVLVSQDFNMTTSEEEYLGNATTWSGPNLSSTHGLEVTWEATEWTTGDDIQVNVIGNQSSTITMKAWEVAVTEVISAGGTDSQFWITESGKGEPTSKFGTESDQGNRSLAGKLEKKASAILIGDPSYWTVPDDPLEGYYVGAGALWTMVKMPAEAVPYGNPNGSCYLSAGASGNLAIETSDEDNDIWGGGKVTIGLVIPYTVTGVQWEFDIDYGNKCEARGGLGFSFTSDILDPVRNDIYTIGKSSGNSSTSGNVDFNYTNTEAHQWVGLLSSTPTKEAYARIDGKAGADGDVKLTVDYKQMPQNSEATISSTGSCFFKCSDVSAVDPPLNNISITLNVF